jgi:hypothetical protein
LIIYPAATTQTVARTIKNKLESKRTNRKDLLGEKIKIDVKYCAITKVMIL